MWVVVSTEIGLTVTLAIVDTEEPTESNAMTLIDAAEPDEGALRTVLILPVDEVDIIEIHSPKSSNLKNSNVKILSPNWDDQE